MVYNIELHSHRVSVYAEPALAPFWWYCQNEQKSWIQ